MCFLSANVVRLAQLDRSLISSSHSAYHVRTSMCIVLSEREASGERECAICLQDAMESLYVDVVFMHIYYSVLSVKNERVKKSRERTIVKQFMRGKG